MSEDYQKTVFNGSEPLDELHFQEVYRTSVHLSVGGYLVINQDSFKYGKPVSVYLSPEQIETIGRYAESLKDEQWAAWNGYKGPRSSSDEVGEEQ